MPISTVNLDQVMNVGEDFEGYIEKLQVNFVPYTLTMEDNNVNLPFNYTYKIHKLIIHLKYIK